MNSYNRKTILFLTFYFSAVKYICDRKIKSNYKYKEEFMRYNGMAAMAVVLRRGKKEEVDVFFDKAVVVEVIDDIAYGFDLSGEQVVILNLK